MSRKSSHKQLRRWLRAAGKDRQTPNFHLEASAAVEFHAAAEGENAGGKRPSFSIEAYNGGLLRVAGYFRPMVVDLAGLRANAAVTILKDHDSSQIVGQGVAKINSRRVTVQGTVTGDHETHGEPAQQVVSHARNGFVWAASVGVLPERVEWVDAGAKVKVNGQSFVGPIGIVRAGRLGEVSFVGIGADETASATVAAQASNPTGDNAMNFDAWLKAKGFDAESLSETQTTALRAAYAAEQEPDETPKTESPQPPTGSVQASAGAGAGGGAGGAPSVAEQMRLEAAAEQERIAAIRKACGDDHGELCAKAIREGWSADKAELEVVKASRPTPPSVHDSRPVDLDEKVLEAGILMAAAGSVRAQLEEHYDERVLEAANSQFGRGGVGVGELLLILAEQNTGRRFRARDLRAQGGMKEVLQAAFSTVSLSGILSNVANKYLLAGYEYGDNSDQRIVGVRTVNDFKQVTSFRMTGNSQFQEVGPDGELKHGTLAEGSFTNQARTYGIMWSLTRQMLINDDLGAFEQMQKITGQGAAHKRRSVVWSAFMDNAGFFKTANKNYKSGADTALSVDALTLAIQMFRDQKDGNGQPIGIDPALLLVPTALEGTARTIHLSQEIRNPAAKEPTTNIHRGVFEPVVSSYLGNTAYAGNSAKAWFMLADPQMVPTIEVCYLNGVQSPTIETADADFNTLGVLMRGFFDFGVSLQDPKGGVKMKGEA